MGIWKFFYNIARIASFFSIFFASSDRRQPGKKFFYCFCKSLSFFSKGFPVKASLHHPGLHGNAYIGICFRICCICSKNLTETGFLRLMTSHGNDGSMISSCCIKGINRICKGKPYPELQHLLHRRPSCQIQRTDGFSALPAQRSASFHHEHRYKVFRSVGKRHLCRILRFSMSQGLPLLLHSKGRSWSVLPFLIGRIRSWLSAIFRNNASRFSFSILYIHYPLSATTPGSTSSNVKLVSGPFDSASAPA